MTEDQIKAIAEEYAKALEEFGGFNPTEMRTAIVGAISFLHFLSSRYCIVEREKVMEFYNGNPGDLAFIEIISTRKVLESLFGTSMFNQNDE